MSRPDRHPSPNVPVDHISRCHVSVANLNNGHSPVSSDVHYTSAPSDETAGRWNGAENNANTQ